MDFPLYFQKLKLAVLIEILTFRSARWVFEVLHVQLAAQFADSVDFKDGLLNNRVCTVKFLAEESYFSCNTTHTV